MFVCTKFLRNRSRDFEFRARKPPQKFGVKEVAFKKQSKNISHRYISLNTFHPRRLTFGREFFLFSSKISHACLLNDITTKKQHKTASRMLLRHTSNMQTKFTTYKPEMEPSRTRFVVLENDLYSAGAQHFFD